MSKSDEKRENEREVELELEAVFERILHGVRTDLIGDAFQCPRALKRGFSPFNKAALLS